jgi:hypothetical protein
MSQLGIGAMLGMLSEDPSSDAYNKSIGKKISDLHIQDNEIIITFDDKSKLKIFDDGQSCCESRYMSTDDDLTQFKEATLRDVELLDCKSDDDGDYGSHDIQFLRVSTDKGDFRLASHNEHNGYYGGFSIRAEVG